MVENMLSSVALHSSFVLAVDMDPVVVMGLWKLGVRLEANYFGQGKPSDAFELYGSKAKLDTGAKFCILRQRTSEERARLEPECMNHQTSFSNAN